MRLDIRVFIAACSVFALTACGGGGGGGGSRAAAPPTNAVNSDFDQGIFRSAALYENTCAVPRGAGFTDTQGSRDDENDWLRAWSHDLYLWYNEIVDEDPRLYSTPDYFDLMKTFASTPSGAHKDQFHFTFDTEAWRQLSQSGVSAGYGAEFVIVAPEIPREVLVAFVEPNAPAALAGITRGVRILSVDGVDVANAATSSEVDVINAGLFPSAAGVQHTFQIEDFDGANPRTVTLTTQTVTQNPVPVTQIFNTPTGPAGYLLFNTHIATAEAELVAAMNQFIAANINHLIVDLRYNGGGFLDIANQLAFMIAGPAAAQGRVFYETQFNDKYPNTNPVTGQALAPDFFHTTTQGFSLGSGAPLPSLNLDRVYILTGSGTCSASEAIVNGLRGIDIEVILIGEPTCGKPYGFYATDNCGTTYFSIQFRGINAKGFGDYADGFVPTQTPLENYEVQGCASQDDFGNRLGDPAEARLATALSYIETNSCPVQAVAFNQDSKLKQARLQKTGPSLEPSQRIPGLIKRR